MLEGASKPIEVLLVEDNAGDVRLTQEALNESRVAVNLTVAKDGLEAIEMLYQHQTSRHGQFHDIVKLLEEF
jgi:chemotaxis family two-component system response regulator Rcp1